MFESCGGVEARTLELGSPPMPLSAACEQLSKSRAYKKQGTRRRRCGYGHVKAESEEGPKSAIVPEVTSVYETRSTEPGELVAGRSPTCSGACAQTAVPFFTVCACKLLVSIP